jgi:sodium-dependent dicarboxylate transporter 2/3/5
MLIIIGLVLSHGVETCHVADFQHTDHMNKAQKQLSLILITMVLLLLVNSPVKPFYDGLGISEKGILLGFGLLMFIPFFGFLEWEDTKKIPYEIIFLFGAGFSIAKAFLDTGFAGEIADLLITFSQIETFYLILLIAAFVTFSTEITSNTALVSMILPVIYALAVDTGLNHQLFLMVATICASYAFMLPIATPPNAIAMSSGVIRIKDMVARGFLFNIVGILTISVFAIFYWRGFF